eukprot:scaffold7732_cov122-Isochrysis_galbana.AAC.2
MLAIGHWRAPPILSALSGCPAPAMVIYYCYNGGSMPGPAKHPSLRHPTTIRYVQPRPPSARHPQPDSSLTPYAPASHVLRRPEVPEGILWRQAPTTNKKGADQAAQSAGSHFFHCHWGLPNQPSSNFKPTELTPTRDPINHPYTVGCALNTALKQALSQPKQPTSSRTASASDSDSVKRFLLTVPWPLAGYTPTPTFRSRSTRTSEKPQMTLAPLEALETNLSNEPKEVSSPPA